MLFFSLVCVITKVIKQFEVKTDVQKGVQKPREKIENRCASFK